MVNCWGFDNQENLTSLPEADTVLGPPKISSLERVADLKFNL